MSLFEGDGGIYQPSKAGGWPNQQVEHASLRSQSPMYFDFIAREEYVLVIRGKSSKRCDCGRSIFVCAAMVVRAPKFELTLFPSLKLGFANP